MRPDADLKKDVLAELASDPAVEAGETCVTVKDGLVSLHGRVDSLAERYAVEKALRRVPGMKALAMNLSVVPRRGHERTDAEIAAAAEHLLGWQTLVNADHIHMSVARGWVTLKGEVDWDYQRRGIEKMLAALQGARGISNQITLKDRATPADVACIQESLVRQATREAHRVQIEVDGSEVRLGGRVHGWQERDAAEAAWSVPGVRSVVNEIEVGP